MSSPPGERAIADAIRIGKAVIKFVTKNDAGITGAHQYGFHLPIGCWQLFSPHPPVKGRNDEHAVAVTWQDDRVTKSQVKWYGDKTRFEYRLTRFGKSFPFRSPDNVGDVLVLVPTSPSTFNGYVLNPEEDLEELEAQLGIDLTSRRMACYERGLAPPTLGPEAAKSCIERQFDLYAASLQEFPHGSDLTEETWRVLAECDPAFASQTDDRKLVLAKETEYELFKKIERRLVWDDIQSSPKSVDDYVEKANSIVNRRKSRAGRSLENHFGVILREHSIRYDARPAASRECRTSSFQVKRNTRTLLFR